MERDNCQGIVESICYGKDVVCHCVEDWRWSASLALTVSLMNRADGRIKGAFSACDKVKVLARLVRQLTQNVKRGTCPAASNMTTPEYLFKVVTAKPDETSDRIALSELDKQSGFIHLSTGAQIPQTCHLFFSRTDELHIIKFSYDKIKDKTKWE